jgi:hypothetical protein
MNAFRTKILNIVKHNYKILNQSASEKLYIPFCEKDDQIKETSLKYIHNFPVKNKTSELMLMPVLKRKSDLQLIFDHIFHLEKPILVWNASMT